MDNKINTQIIDKYKSYSPEQFAKEFLLGLRPKNEGKIIENDFVRFKMPFLIETYIDSEGRKCYVYSDIQATSHLTPMYKLYERSLLNSPYSLNFRALANVFQRFVHDNNPSVKNVNELPDYFYKTFDELLLNTYSYLEENKLSL